MINIINFVLGFITSIFIVGLNADEDESMRKSGNGMLLLVALLYRFMWGKSVKGFNYVAVLVLAIIALVSFKFTDYIMPTIKSFSKIISSYLSEIRNSDRDVKSMLTVMVVGSIILTLFGLVGYYDPDRAFFIILGILTYLLLVEATILRNNELVGGLTSIIDSLREGLLENNSIEMYKPTEVDDEDEIEEEDVVKKPGRSKPNKKVVVKEEVEEDEEVEELNFDPDDEGGEDEIPNTNIGLGKSKPIINSVPQGIGVPPAIGAPIGMPIGVPTVPPTGVPIGMPTGVPIQPNSVPINNGIVRPE